MTSKDAVYSYIVDYALKHNRLPGQTEIAHSCHMSRNNVGYILNKLCSEGKVKIENEILTSYTITGINYKDEREVAS